MGGKNQLGVRKGSLGRYDTEVIPSRGGVATYERVCLRPVLSVMTPQLKFI